MARETILLTRQEIADQIDVTHALPAIESAMGEYEKGNDYLPNKAIFEIPMEGSSGAWAVCITGYTRAANLLSMKVGQERTDNMRLQLPTTNSWIPAFDPRTGELLMICDGTLPTMLRTAAAAAVATKHLARSEARTLAVIGAGQLGRQCVRLVSLVRKFEKILLCDVVSDAAKRTAGDLASQVNVPIQTGDVEATCCQADVIVTATASREPIVMADWVRPGTHLSCMGADLPDKIECEMKLLSKCRIFADEREHAIKRGEVSQAVEEGVLREDCYVGSLGQVINGDLSGRTDDMQITMYDGVGIGIQDTTIARTIYDQAVAKRLGVSFSFS